MPTSLSLPPPRRLIKDNKVPWISKTARTKREYMRLWRRACSPSPRSGEYQGKEQRIRRFSVPSGNNARKKIKDSMILRNNSLRAGAGNFFTLYRDSLRSRIRLTERPKGIWLGHDSRRISFSQRPSSSDRDCPRRARGASRGPPSERHHPSRPGLELRTGRGGFVAGRRHGSRLASGLRARRRRGAEELWP